MAMVVATVRIVPRAGQVGHTVEIVRAFADATRVLPGCHAATALVETGPPQGLVYVETWLDEKHLELHLKSPAYDRMLHLMEASAEPPTVHFRFVAESRDLTWVEELRLRAPLGIEMGGAVRARRARSSPRRTRRVGALLVLSMASSQTPRLALAGESFLSRNPKAPEALPYGRDLDSPAADRTPPASGDVPRATPTVGAEDAGTPAGQEDDAPEARR